MDDSGWKQARRSGSQMWNIFWIGEIFELTVSGKKLNFKHTQKNNFSLFFSTPWFWFSQLDSWFWRLQRLVCCWWLGKAYIERLQSQSYYLEGNIRSKWKPQNKECESWGCWTPSPPWPWTSGRSRGSTSSSTENLEKGLLAWSMGERCPMVTNSG